MKLFVGKILLFVILLTAGAFAVDTVVTKGLQKASVGAFQTWNDIFNKRIQSDVIILGSSRAEVHISPAILDSIMGCNSYNFGESGYPFHTQLARYKTFEKYNQKPEVIVQCVDYNTFTNLNNINRVQFLPYIQEENLSQELNELGFTGLELKAPAVRYTSRFSYIMRGIKDFFNIGYSPKERYKGYHGEDRKWNGTKLQAIKDDDSMPAAALQSDVIDLFDFFLNDCKNRNIEVVMVFTPVYIDVTNYTKDKELIINRYKSLSEKYNFRFLDYTRDSMCCDTTFFYNAMHLNKTGSEIFSRKLAHDLDTIGILHKGKE